MCHNLVSTFFVNENEKHPLDLRIYLKKEVVQNLKTSFKTKITLAKELISEAHKAIDIELVVIDAWYFANELVKHLKELELDWITNRYNTKSSIIETFYRDAKQHLGLGDYQMRKLNGVVTHLHLVFLAHTRTMRAYI